MNAPLPLSANAAPAATFAPADRIRSIGVSDIVRISQAANELKRQGQPVIVLGLGEPDFDTPAHVLEAAQQAMAQGETHYTALDGTPALKAAIQLKFRRDERAGRGSGFEKPVVRHHGFQRSCSDHVAMNLTRRKLLRLRIDDALSVFTPAAGSAWTGATPLRQQVLEHMHGDKG